MTKIPAQSANTRFSQLSDRWILGPGTFRIALALCVLISHFSSLNIGHTAVSLFFMLSGFWIPFLWTKIGASGAGKFFLNRLFRIFPLYLMVTFICIYFFPVRLTPSTFLLLGVASTEGPRAIGVEWSLDVELQFYIAFPVFAFLLKQGLAGRGLLVVLFLLGWIFYRLTGIMSVLQFIPAFATGMCIFYFRPKISSLQAACALLGGVLIYLIAAAIPLTRGLALSVYGPSIIDPDLFAILVSLVMAPYVAASLNVRSGALDRSLGDTSYPLYLVHEPLIRGYKQVFGMPAPDARAQLLTAKIEVFVACLIIAAVVYLVIDRPMEKLRRRLLD